MAAELCDDPVKSTLLLLRHNVGLQKLEQLVGLFAPGRKSQRDVAMLEKLIFDICNQAVDADSPFGKALRGPNPFPPPHHNRLPAALPPWGRVDLEKKKDWRLANKRRLTTSCLQARHEHSAIGQSV